MIFKATCIFFMIVYLNNFYQIEKLLNNYKSLIELALFQNYSRIPHDNNAQEHPLVSFLFQERRGLNKK